MTRDSLPDSLDAEQVMLGSCLSEASLSGTSEVSIRMLSMLRPEQFSSFATQHTCSAIAACIQMGMPPTPQLVAEELKRDGTLQQVGGTSWLLNLTVGIPQGMNLSHYAVSIREASARREIARLGERLSREALEGVDSTEQLLAEAQESIFRLSVESQLEAKSPARSYGDIASEVTHTFDKWQAGDSVAVPTQIPELDERLNYGGFAGGDLIVIAARTSFGKSALALQVVLNSARAGIPALVFSLEMSAERLFIRNLASVSQVPHYKISPRTFLYNPGLGDAIRRHIPTVGKLPISVDHTTRKLRRLTTVAREWHKGLDPEQKKRAILVTDYMQLVDNKLDRRSRNDEVAGISIELKGLAVEFGIPVVGVSQLTRSPAKDNRRPELPDLRESGQLEQDADLVIFPWSQDGLKDDRVRGMQLYCPKQRGGQVGWEIPIDFDGDKQWFFTERMYAEERGELTRRIDFNE